MKKYIAGFDPVKKSSNPCVAVIIHKGETAEGTLVAEYHYRPFSNKAFQKEVKRAARYFGAALKKFPKNWFK